ncbi:MAG: hypothetical protein H7A53_03365 [Akkermansiaceae bacterium]|nr:hypothetical protein [Akkermansiaceae bacterium]
MFKEKLEEIEEVFRTFTTVKLNGFWTPFVGRTIVTAWLAPRTPFQTPLMALCLAADCCSAIAFAAPVVLAESDLALMGPFIGSGALINGGFCWPSPRRRLRSVAF